MRRLSQELQEKAKVIKELEVLVDQQKDQCAEEIEAVKMRSELERLRQLDEVRRQLEEVQCQGNKERERFREEREKSLIMLEKLLAEEKARHMEDNGVTGDVGECECEWFRREGQVVLEQLQVAQPLGEG